jgi:hypothetical protein
MAAKAKGDSLGQFGFRNRDHPAPGEDVGQTPLLMSQGHPVLPVTPQGAVGRNARDQASI